VLREGLKWILVPKAAPAAGTPLAIHHCLALTPLYEVSAAALRSTRSSGPPINASFCESIIMVIIIILMVTKPF